MIEPLRVLIVDDVTLARQRLRRLLGAQPAITVLGEAGDATEALLAIQALTPDLVFLDIEMPERDGFSVLSALKSEECPMIVFVTAYDQYAVRAFEANAVDYLLKPVEPERLAATLQRVRERRGNGGVHARLGALTEALAARNRYMERISVRGSDATEVVRVLDIDWIEAAGNYLCLRAGSKTHVVRDTLTEMQGRLDPSRFVRIHRSRIVNIERIAKMTPLFNGDHTVILHDGTELALSRTYRAALFAALGTGD